MATIGRPSLFGSRDGGDRVQGVLTKTGAYLFERARKELAEKSGVPWGKISDSDVIEFLARDRAFERK